YGVRAESLSATDFSGGATFGANDQFTIQIDGNAAVTVTLTGVTTTDVAGTAREVEAKIKEALEGSDDLGNEALAGRLSVSADGDGLALRVDGLGTGHDVELSDVGAQAGLATLGFAATSTTEGSGGVFQVG